MLPRPGDYGVTPGGGWPMWWVRAWTGHPPFLRPAWAGHAAIVVSVKPAVGALIHDDTPLTVEIIEATPDAGVRKRALRPDELSRWRFSNFTLSDAQRWAIVDGAYSALGKPYDWPSVIGVGVRVLVARYRGHAADHPDERLFCSELVAWLYRDAAGHDLFPGIAPGTVSPDALDRRRTGPLSLLGGSAA